jgi:AmmeMemoRadiSam system protein B
MSELPESAQTIFVRPPAWAGRFYPEDPAELRETIEGFLRAVPPRPGLPPKAIIAPHAGYPYSGPIAATAYARLAPLRASISRVVLLGPSHHVGFRGIAATDADGYETPLGVVPIDRKAMAAAQHLAVVHLEEAAHRHEHSLEVHVPFLQCVFREFQLVPFVVGDATAIEVSALLEVLWDGPETLIVVSTDLSHYLPYDQARELDAATAAEIVALRPNDLGPRDACGCRPLRGLLRTAQSRGLHCERLDLRNSGDTAGSRHRVVGYGAFVLS